jgi:hypothetical protein
VRPIEAYEQSRWPPAGAHTPAAFFVDGGRTQIWAHMLCARLASG